MLTVMNPPGDLEPRYDVRGGSPKTPIPPISASEYQGYAVQTHGNGIFKMLAGAAGGLWIMAMLAWWTAFQGKGITRDELRNEMKEYKDSIRADLLLTNTQIGELKGKQEQALQRLSKVEYQQITDERDFIEFKTETKNNNKLVADYLEAQKVKK